MSWGKEGPRSARKYMSATEHHGACCLSPGGVDCVLGPNSKGTCQVLNATDLDRDIKTCTHRGCGMCPAAPGELGA